jgi:hypothetical protein
MDSLIVKHLQKAAFNSEKQLILGYFSAYITLRSGHWRKSGKYYKSLQRGGIVFLEFLSNFLEASLNVKTLSNSKISPMNMCKLPVKFSGLKKYPSRETVLSFRNYKKKHL